MPSKPMKQHRGLAMGDLPVGMNKRMGQGVNPRYSDTEGFKDMDQRMFQGEKKGGKTSESLAMRMKQGGQKIGKSAKKR